jgi:apolipoprotein D and lipocalin family protein
MVKRNLIMEFINFVALVGPGPSGRPPLQIVPSVNLSQYAGLWYEFARLPNNFQDKKGKKCDFVTAEYTLRKDGYIRVVNRCLLGDGEVKVVEGVGRVTDKQTNARLEVNFGPEFLRFLPFICGNYNIIELAPDYSYALVGSSDRKGLWILSREPHLDEVIFEKLLDKAAEQSFNIGLVTKTKQNL